MPKKYNSKSINTLIILLFIIFSLKLITENVFVVTIIVIRLGLFAYKFKNYKILKFLAILTAMTPIERKMYYDLIRAGYNPIPQYQSGKYRLDFAIFQNGLKIDIECDGKQYHSTPAQKAHDRNRTRKLNKEGWNVIRFSGRQIYKNVDQCVERINKK